MYGAITPNKKALKEGEPEKQTAEIKGERDPDSC